MEVLNLNSTKNYCKRKTILGREGSCNLFEYQQVIPTIGIDLIATKNTIIL